MTTPTRSQPPSTNFELVDHPKTGPLWKATLGDYEGWGKTKEDAEIEMVRRYHLAQTAIESFYRTIREARAIRALLSKTKGPQ